MNCYSVEIKQITTVAAQQLLTPEYLSISILSLKPTIDTYPECFSEEIQKKINTIHLINYQPNEIKQITKEILNDHLPYCNVLEVHHFNLAINNDLLFYISQNYNSFIPFYPFISQCILQFYLSWMISYHQKKSREFLNNLLLNLILISQPSNNPIFPKIQFLALSAFFHLFNCIDFQTLNNIDFTVLLENLKIYYSIEANLPEQAYTLLSEAAKSILSLPPSKSNEETSASFFEYVISLLNTLGDRVPTDIVQNVISSLLPFLSKLDPKALSYFKCLSKYISNASHIFDVFATTIYRELSQRPPFLNLVCKKASDEELEREKLRSLSATEVTLRFWDDFTSPKWFNLKENFHLPEKKSDRELIPLNLKVILDMIIESTHNKKELVANMLDSFSFLASNFALDDQYRFDSSCIFLCICCQLKEFVRGEDIIKILMDKPFFDPAITIFNNMEENKVDAEKNNDSVATETVEKSEVDESKDGKPQESDFNVIDTMRTYIIDIALNHMQYFEQFMLKWVQYPHLFTEIIHRIIQNPHLHIDTTNVNIISKGLMVTSIYYQQLHHNDTKHTSLIETVRRSLFLLISQILQLPYASLLLFSNSIFVSFFPSFIFELPIRSFVLSSMLSFLTKYEEIPTDFFQSMIFQIIQICSRLFPEEKCIVMVMDLLQTFNEAFIHQRKLAKCFEPLCSWIFSSLSGLNNSEISKNYALTCIQFFALASFRQPLNNVQVSELENSIHTIFNDVIPQQLSNRLIQMIAGEVLPSLSPTFIIRQPKVLTLFLKISLKDNNLLKTIQFLDQLCQFSALNCQICHLSEFDHYLIDLINEMKDSPIEILTAIFTLFQRIASVMSSVSIVQRFISLLSPINGQQIPKNMNLYLKTLNNIVSTASRLPVVSLPLTENSAQIEIHGLTTSDIASGFTFVFWINIDYSLAQYRPMIFSITDAKGRVLRWFLSETNLFCTQRSTETESNGKIDANLPISTWTFVAVRYQIYPEERIVEMRTIFGSDEAKPFEFCDMPFQPGPLTCKVGGVAPKSVHSDLITRLGAFGMFKPLTNEQIASIYEMGPRLSGVLTESPFFFFKLDEINDSLILKMKSSQPNIEAKMSFSSIRFNTTFSDILINFCKVEILLPLFSELDMPMENGGKYQNFVKTIIELLGNTLVISNRAQEMFCRASGFAIISHLLLSSSVKNIDYSLYLQFFTLMQSFTSENLQRDLLKYILLNLNIWIKTDAENHMRIVRHLARVIFPSLKYLINEIISFQEILYMLRAFYYYNPVNEEEDNIQIKRCEGLNISECRQLMCNMATSLSSESFSADDFDCLASHCITCAETKQIPDLLRLLKNLIISHPSPLLKITSQIDVIYFLYSLFNKHSDEINLLIIENVIALHKYGILKPESLHLHIIRLQNQLSPSILNNDFFQNLVSLMVTSYPQMLPICSFAALSMEEELIIWFIQQLQNNPHPEYYQHFAWCMWPILLCYDKGDAVRIEMMNFFVELPETQWQNIFIMIIYIASILDCKYDDLLKLFIQVLVGKKDFDNNQLSIFFKLCSFYLFSPSKTLTGSAFDLIFKNSVFCLEPIVFPVRSLSSFIKHPISLEVNRPSIDSESCRSMIKSKSMLLNQEKNSNAALTEKNEKIMNKSPKSSIIGSFKFSLEEESGGLYSGNPKSYSDFYDDKHHKIDNILEKIKAITLHSSPYHFNLRFGIDMNWSDIEIAKQFIEVFHKFKNRAYLEIYLIILAFISREDPLYVQSHLSAINLTSEEVHANESAICLIYHHANQSGNSILYSNKTEEEIEEIYFHYIDSHRFTQQHEINRLCLNLSFRLKELVKETTKNSFMLKNYPTLVYCQEQLSAFSHLNERQLIDNKRKWMKLWRCLAIDHAPWDCNTHGEAHFKRDNTFCLHFCPFKIKRNWKFDDHKESLMAREQNSTESAAELFIKEDLEHRKSKYIKKAPIQLLEINDNDIENFYSDECIAYFDPLTAASSRSASKEDISFMKKLIFKADCEYITPTTTTKHEINGVFYLTKEFIRIIFAEVEHRQPKTIYLSEIHSLFFRRSYHRPNSIEIFTTNGRCYYIHFKNHNSLAIIKKISSLSLPNAINVQTVDFYQYFQKNSLTEKWVNGEISNFEYIMHLNVMSGRTFNDLTQYPLFPWIIGQYDNKEFSIMNENFFRDLSKPVGALDEGRLNKLMEKYQEMKRNGKQPYLYDHGSSFMTATCSFLLRLEPFTSEYFTILKGSNENDYFSSIKDSYKSVTTKLEDYRELIPEFFFMPEVFLNLNHYDLDEQSGDVKLPSWASTAEEFIYLHRKALECDYVSSLLNNWIDLIWGFKQRGDASIKANNVFQPFMYDDIWNDINSFKENRSNIENILLYRGQVPPQLFKEKHPVKSPKTSVMYFKKPYLFKANTNGLSVAFSYVKANPSENKYIITVVTVDGTVIIHNIKFAKSKKASKGMIERTKSQVPSAKAPSQSPHSNLMNTSISDTSLSRKVEDNVGESHQSLISSQSTDFFDAAMIVTDIKDATIKFSTNKIKGFSDHKISITDKPGSVAHLMNGKFTVISAITNKVMLVDIINGTTEIMPCQLSDAVAVAISDDLLAVASNDAVLTVFKSKKVIRAAAAVASMKSSASSNASSSSSAVSNINQSNSANGGAVLNNNSEEFIVNMTPIISMPSYRDSISCCCLSKTFFTAVIGTRDGSLIINSLNKGSTVRVIDLEGAKPCMVTITNGWGFIVCYASKLMCGQMSHYLYVFNINGIKLRKKNIGFEINLWSHFTSSKGFDYMIVSDERGKLFSFEVFYLNLDESFYRCYSPVSTLEYFPNLNAVLFVTKDGKIMFYPYSIC